MLSADVEQRSRHCTVSVGFGGDVDDARGCAGLELWHKEVREQKMAQVVRLGAVRRQQERTKHMKSAIKCLRK